MPISSLINMSDRLFGIHSLSIHIRCVLHICNTLLRSYSGLLEFHHSRDKSITEVIHWDHHHDDVTLYARGEVLANSHPACTENG